MRSPLSVKGRLDARGPFGTSRRVFVLSPQSSRWMATFSFVHQRRPGTWSLPPRIETVRSSEEEEQGLQVLGGLGGVSFKNSMSAPSTQGCLFLTVNLRPLGFCGKLRVSLRLSSNLREKATGERLLGQVLLRVFLASVPVSEDVSLT